MDNSGHYTEDALRSPSGALECVHCGKLIIEPQTPIEIIRGLTIRTANGTCSEQYGDDKPMHLTCWRDVLNDESSTSRFDDNSMERLAQWLKG